MTTEQFETLITLLKEINENVKLITAKDTGNNLFGLSDVCSEISNVESAVSSVESAVNDVKSAINNLDLS